MRSAARINNRHRSTSRNNVNQVGLGPVRMRVAKRIKLERDAALDRMEKRKDGFQDGVISKEQ